MEGFLCIKIGSVCVCLLSFCVFKRAEVFVSYQIVVRISRTQLEMTVTFCTFYYYHYLYSAFSLSIVRSRFHRHFSLHTIYIGDSQ